MYCDTCGNRLPDDARFCEVCGTEVVQPSKNTRLYIILGIVLAAILAIIIGVFGFVLFYMNGKVDPGNDDGGGGGVTQTPTPEPTQTPTPEPTQTPTPEPTPISTPKPTAESTYIYVIKDCSWSQAQAECAALGGHLVHFDTPGEVEKVIVDFTIQGYSNKSKFWIGGARNSFNSSYVYNWINADGSYAGEISLSDSHWMSGEPSYMDPGLNNLLEDKMIMYYYNNEWVFNDEPDQLLQYIPSYAGTVGYICEIEG